MPLNISNLEPLINMLNAIVQRQETVRQLAAQLHSAAIWRSPDGSLAVEITPEQQREISTFAQTYLAESEVIIASARAILGQPEEGGLS
jgi:hypothetical protein